MRKLALAFASSILFAFPLVGVADEEIDPFLTTTPEGPPERGISLGLRLGYGFPMGSASGATGDSLSSLFKGAVPIQLGIGWRFNPKIYAGLYFEYAFVSLADAKQQDCTTSGVSCSATDVRFGGDFTYTFLPYAKFAPWAGAGLGFEISKYTVSAGSGLKSDLTIRGFDFHLMGGADYRLSSVFRVGPFACLVLGQYSTVEQPATGGTQTLDIANKAFHGWLQLGVRMTADL